MLIKQKVYYKLYIKHIWSTVTIKYSKVRKIVYNVNIYVNKAEILLYTLNK